MLGFGNWTSKETVHTVTDYYLFWAAWLLHVPLLFFLIYAAINGDWKNVAANAIAILIAFVPRLMESNSGYRFPAIGEFALAVVLFVEMLGRTFHLYEGHPFPFDVLSHGMIIGVISMFIVLLIYAFFVRQNIDYDTWFIIVAGVIIGLGIGALYELYEWMMDMFFNTNLLHGIRDTMIDLAVGGLGAFIGAWLAKLYRSRHSQEELAQELPIFYDWL
ncbi:MAG: hypothetical protein M3220_00175 [Chloroflexota bacterium]|nr:hypothetical protein [Chloroflexota bacterium]